MHAIRIDHRTALVDVRLSVFFAPEDAIATTRAVRDAIRTLGPRIGDHVTLYDATDVGVSPPATVAMMQRAFREPEAQRLAARRVAYCSPSALGRIQLARLREARGDIGVFADRASALAWLLAPSAGPDTPAA